MIVRDKLGGDCIQIRSTDCSNDNAGGRTFIVYLFTQLWKWKEGCRKELPLREDDGPGGVDQEAVVRGPLISFCLHLINPNAFAICIYCNLFAIICVSSKMNLLLMLTY